MTIYQKGSCVGKKVPLRIFIKTIYFCAAIFDEKLQYMYKCWGGEKESIGMKDRLSFKEKICVTRYLALPHLLKCSQQDNDCTSKTLVIIVNLKLRL